MHAQVFRFLRPGPYLTHAGGWSSSKGWTYRPRTRMPESRCTRVNPMVDPTSSGGAGAGGPQGAAPGGGGMLGHVYRRRGRAPVGWQPPPLPVDVRVGAPVVLEGRAREGRARAIAGWLCGERVPGGAASPSPGWGHLVASFRSRGVEGFVCPLRYIARLAQYILLSFRTNRLQILRSWQAIYESNSKHLRYAPLTSRIHPRIHSGYRILRYPPGYTCKIQCTLYIIIHQDTYYPIGNPTQYDT